MTPTRLLLPALLAAGLAGGYYGHDQVPALVAAWTPAPAATCPTPGPAPVGAQAALQAPAADGRPNLNTATAEQLDALPVPGLGAARARHVVEYRTAHGPFRSVEELASVPGLPGDVAARLGAAVAV